MSHLVSEKFGYIVGVVDLLIVLKQIKIKNLNLKLDLFLPLNLLLMAQFLHLHSF